MADLITTWNSNLTHISNGDGKTRCGRTLKQYRSNNTERECSRCGTHQDYEIIRADLRQAYLAQQEKEEQRHQEQVARDERRRETFKQTLDDLITLLQENGADVSDVHKAISGGRLEFELNGLKFKLSGNIW
jgi:hypothetical protein